MSVTDAPRAPFRPQTTELHGETRVDGYGYLKDREDADTIPYLTAEKYTCRAGNGRYRDSARRPLQEFLSRIEEDDQGVPYRHGDFLYYDRTEQGKAYPIFCRKTLEENAEEILLDVNKVAEGHEYTSLGALALSPDHRYLAYGVDHAGNELFQIVVKDLETETSYPARSKMPITASSGETIMPHFSLHAWMKHIDRTVFFLLSATSMKRRLSSKNLMTDFF